MILPYLLQVALAGTSVRIEATVGPDLDWVRGTIEIHSDEPMTLIDPLADLPDAPNDIFRRGTFPGNPNRGVVRTTRTGPHTWRFYTLLPHRFGAVGTTPRHGLFANGAWYPQPIGEDGLLLATWNVHVTLPDGVTGAMGDTVGVRELEWRGEGERVSLAVLPRGVLTPLGDPMEPGSSTPAVLLTRGPPRKTLVRELARATEEVPTPAPHPSVVVEAPLRRRLVRPGLGLTYVSDRAFRLFPGLQAVHRMAITRGVLQSSVRRPDPFERALTAAGLAAREDFVNPRTFLRYFSWIPSVDGFLHGKTSRFASDILGDAHSADPVRDDLVEMYAPHTSPLSVVRQMDALGGPGTALSFAEAMTLGRSFSRSAEIAGVTPEWLRGFRAPYPAQDYLLQVRRDPPIVRVRREAPPEAPEEILVVVVDGHRTAHRMGPGSDEVTFTPDHPPHHVTLDPDHDLDQISRVRDSWPPRYHVNLTGYISTINLSEGYVEARGSAILRSSTDSRNRLGGALFTRRDTLLGASLTYSRRIGPMQDGLRRPHTLSVSITPALLNPNYAHVNPGAQISLGTSVGWSWSNQIGGILPRRGHRAALKTSGGWIPHDNQRWVSLFGAWSVVTSPHPSVAWATTTSAGIARGDVVHRLLSLGGPSAIRSVPQGELVGTGRVLAATELRLLPIRNASVPLGLGWGTDLQIALGGEVGVVWTDGAPTEVVGATLGVLGIGDVFGVASRAVGLTMAWPLWIDDPDFTRTATPEIYLRWGQAF